MNNPIPDLAGLRKRIAEALWSCAEHNVVAEWICCEPIKPDHSLCVAGDSARSMLRALILDDPEAYKPAPLPDAVLPLVQQAVAEQTAQLRQQVRLGQEGAADREAILDECRDTLEAAGYNGAHGDDWPRIAPAVRELVADRYRLAAELAALRQVARGYCPECGRGDCAPTVADWEGQKQRAEQAEAEAAELRARLADVEERAAAASYAQALRTPPSAEAATYMRDRLAAKVARVRSLHQPLKRAGTTCCALCSGWDGRFRCHGVVTPWPCPTLQALDGTEEA